jgi:hypothetical protein
MVKHVLLRPLRPELLAAKSTAVTINYLRREVTSVVGLKLSHLDKWVNHWLTSINHMWVIDYRCVIADIGRIYIKGYLYPISYPIIAKKDMPLSFF